MATTKLRKTFKYPADDSEEDDSPEALDEEEQEKLIAKMREENDERNQEYLRLFLAVPLISVMTFLPAVMMSPLYQAKLISFFCVSSLLASAYMLVFVPNDRGGGTSQPREVFTTFATDSKPIHKYLPYLNGALSLLLAINAINWRGRRGVHEGFWVLCLLPAVVFSITVAARKIMLDVDINELERLKYGYKGA
ncbi:hypothetical protein MMC30_000698 [Trapelia coarctata]|nr:hypothetical protein [Trapelia coarctata]